MAELLHVDAVQQSEVALLGSPVPNVVALLSAGLEQTKPIFQTTQSHPQTYTSTPPAPIPVVVLVLGTDWEDHRVSGCSSYSPEMLSYYSSACYFLCFSSTIH